jgi:ammonia channel protein AmtB
MWLCALQSLLAGLHVKPLAAHLQNLSAYSEHLTWLVCPISTPITRSGRASHGTSCASCSHRTVCADMPTPATCCPQMTFAIITPGLIVGAFAERMKFSAMMLFCTLWAFVVYFPAAHAVWGGPGSFFGDMGVMDFAGGIVVHITAGIAALVACIMVRTRVPVSCRTAACVCSALVPTPMPLC